MGLNSVSSRIHKTITSVVFLRHIIRSTEYQPCALIKEFPISKDRDGNIVTEGIPGILQFYNPVTDKHVRSLVVVKNYFREQNPTIARIEQIEFTSNGDWLITADGRSITRPGGRVYDGPSTEWHSFIKFWHYSDITQNYELTTQVKSPHEKIVAMAVCSKNSIVVTTGSEGKFVIWEKTVLANEPGVNSKIVQESWRCRSVGYYRNQSANAAAFSDDGSLLAISYGSIITLWDPVSIVLKHTLQFSQAEYKLTRLAFITDSPFLVASSLTHLYVWNLLTKKIHWFTELTIIHSVVVDPVLPRFSVLMNKLPFSTSIYKRQTKEFKIPGKFAKVVDTKSIGERPTFTPPAVEPKTFIPPVIPGVETTAKRRPITIPKKIPPSECFLLCFDDMNSCEPFSITRLKQIPRTGLVNLSTKNRASNPAQTVAYLSDFEVVIVGDPKFTAECKRKSIRAQRSFNKQSGEIFSEIFGELKNAANIQQNDILAEKSALTGESKELAILDSPSHLIPSVKMLFSTFMESKLGKAEVLDESKKESGVVDEPTEMDVDDADLGAESPISLQSEVFDNFSIKTNKDYALLTKKNQIFKA